MVVEGKLGAGSRLLILEGGSEGLLVTCWIPSPVRTVDQGSMSLLRGLGILTAFLLLAAEGISSRTGNGEPAGGTAKPSTAPRRRLKHNPVWNKRDGIRESCLNTSRTTTEAMV